MGAFLEDYVEGATWISPGRTVTEALVDLYAGLSGDFHAVHTDDDAAASSEFGGRVAHGLLGMAIAFGLLGREGQFEGALIAHLGVEEWKFVKPIRLGDTIRARQRVAGSRRSRSRPGSGIVKLEAEVLNQRSEVVQQGRFVLLVKARNAAAASSPEPRSDRGPNPSSPGRLDSDESDPLKPRTS